VWSEEIFGEASSRKSGKRGLIWEELRGFFPKKKMIQAGREYIGGAEITHNKPGVSSRKEEEPLS